MIFVPRILNLCPPDPHTNESWYHDVSESQQSARLCRGRWAHGHESQNRAERTDSKTINVACTKILVLVDRDIK